ncbi:MAG: serine/threonine protein kinase [Xanthomonadales bacterium]|jgi:Ser/Thr protein kinase RdoA (MazF antagonist)|nr:serine/threonine protein kinase [Xanthomonadales bacterium]
MHPTTSETPYANLEPDLILDAVESLSLQCDGRLLALNSYENRVYQVGIEDAAPLVVKFYRPGRWSDEAILEEHQFSQELVEEELSVVAPMAFDGVTLHHFKDHRFTLFPRQGGHAPELAHQPSLRHLGQVLARLHNVGSWQGFEHRPRLSTKLYGHEARAFIMQGQWLPPHMETVFADLTEHLLNEIDSAWERAGGIKRLRVHGDCHPGNILWREETAHFVDLDDSLMAPAMQDLWMLLAGERHEMQEQLLWILDGYQLFRDFDATELHLLEALRALRLLHYNAWLARRWNDPAFPRTFPWFDSPRHWETLTNQLREQIAAIQEPTLSVI